MTKTKQNRKAIIAICILIAICLSISAIYANGCDKVAYADSDSISANLTKTV
ncbi:MAG: hypothetical protein K2G37_02595 [Clostridia bacterium]|nr:hypothetical protein [Clostridia bacterium]MDE7329474.1 hypothetical protein [Clostridia bacterium]